MNRRHLLTLVPALLASGKAKALSLDENNAHLSELVADRCGVTSEHARYLAEADKILIQAGYGEAERKAVLAALDCPVCGCAITASNTGRPLK
ncbi:MAG: hypothetical protein OEL53_06630 [Rhodospirillales bacterium]|nr:hypothetical protein [Rhodospirillales bacterium]